MDNSDETDTAWAKDTADPRAAWLMDELRELQAERSACEQRIAEIDRVTNAAQVILDELTKKRSAINGSPLQTGLFSISPAPPHKPSRVYARVGKPKTVKGRSQTPTQEEWLAQWAEDHGGIVRISEARPAFIASRLTNANPRNIYGNIMSVMKRSPHFEKIATGTFRWVPYRPMIAQDEPAQEPEESGESSL